ncbi:MAG: hypothetical protein AAF635_12590 [Cyanobacteria bacterium P01_C01_bin.69]
MATCSTCSQYWPEAPHTDGNGGCLAFMEPAHSDAVHPCHSHLNGVTTYQVAYEGQIITAPISYEDACQIAADENADALVQGHLPLCEVVLAA